MVQVNRVLMFRRDDDLMPSAAAFSELDFFIILFFFKDRKT